MLIYIASPYTNAEESVREENYRIVSMIAAEIVAEGSVAFSPITYGHTLLKYKEMPSDWPFWKNFCLTFLSKCDKIIVYKMPGWDKSKGVGEEIEFAKENGIIIEYIEYLPK